MRSGPMGEGSGSSGGARGKILGRGRSRVDAELRREWDERTRDRGDGSSGQAVDDGSHVGAPAPSGKISQVEPNGRLGTEREKAARAAEERLKKQKQKVEEAIAPLPPPSNAESGEQTHFQLGDDDDDNDDDDDDNNDNDREEAEEIDLLA